MNPSLTMNASNLSRRTDPATSKEAAQDGEKSGAFGCQRTVIHEALKSFGDMHAGAIAEETGLLTHQVLKRLSDLQRLEMAFPTDRRVGKQRVWRALESLNA